MIGVFDSGSGGLTILNALMQELPDQSFLYYGDHKNAPYGHRSNEQIVALTKAGVDALMQQGCSLVILACNTAAAVALRTLQQTWLEEAYPGNRILGVLVPMVESITGVPWSAASKQDRNRQGKILLFATRKTVESGAYAEEVAKRAPNILLMEKACPGLVDAIEGGAGEAPLKGLINGYVQETNLSNASAAVLGCTHFPLVEDYFRQALPDTVPIFSQPDMVARSLRGYLDRRPEFKSATPAACRLLTTGEPETANHISRKLFGDEVLFERAEQ